MTDAAAAEPAPKQPWEDLPAGEYAIVELFGHTTLVGKIEEIERFGTKMLAMQPLFAGALLPTPIYHGGAAIYRMTPCSPEVAWVRQPREAFQLPAPIRAIVLVPLLETTAQRDELRHEDHEIEEDDEKPF